MTGSTRMLELGAMELRLDTWPLVDGPVRLRYASVADLHLDLRRNETGEANWSFAPEDDRPDPLEDDDGLPGRFLNPFVPACAAARPDRRVRLVKRVVSSPRSKRSAPKYSAWPRCSASKN